MYFWDLNSLIHDLRQGNDNQRRSFQSLIALICLYTVQNMLFGSLQKPSAPIEIDSVYLVMFALIVPIILYIAYSILRGFYRRNGGDQGRNFLDRLIAIGWVVTFRVSVVSTPFYLAVYLIDRDPLMVKEHALAFLLFMLVVVVWSITYHITTINRAFVEVSGQSA